jgi:hypothetical protein
VDRGHDDENRVKDGICAVAGRAKSSGCDCLQNKASARQDELNGRGTTRR